jgi:hypothetical protein
MARRLVACFTAFYAALRRRCAQLVLGMQLAAGKMQCIGEALPSQTGFCKMSGLFLHYAQIQYS